MSNFNEWSTERKRNYGKQFSKRDRQMYQKGKRNGWLNCFHSGKSKTSSVNNFKSRNYSKEEFKSLYADLNKIKIN